MPSSKTIKGSRIVRQEIILDLSTATSRPEIDHVIAKHTEIISELLPEDRAAVLSNYAHLRTLLPDVAAVTYARPSFSMLFEEHLMAVVTAVLIASIYVVRLMTQHPMSPDFEKSLVDLAVAGSRPGAVWNAFELQRSVQPGWVVGAIWLAAVALVFWYARPRISSALIVATVPLIVPVFFALTNFVTIEGRAASFAAGEQYAYATLYQRGSSMLKSEVQNFWDLRRATGAVFK